MTRPRAPKVTAARTLAQENGRAACVVFVRHYGLRGGLHGNKIYYYIMCTEGYLHLSKYTAEAVKEQMQPALTRNGCFVILSALGKLNKVAGECKTQEIQASRGPQISGKRCRLDVFDVYFTSIYFPRLEEPRKWRKKTWKPVAISGTSEFENSANVGRAHKSGAAAPSPCTCGLRGGFTGQRKIYLKVLSTYNHYLLGGCGKGGQLQYGCWLFVKSDKG